MAMNNMEKNARGDKAARDEEKTVDVFLCYKETDKETEAGAAEGIDVLAPNEQLAGAGYRVLFPGSPWRTSPRPDRSPAAESWIRKAGAGSFG